MPRPTERYRLLASYLHDLPADHNSRGLFVDGPQLVTNWDLLVRLMGASAVYSPADIADALGVMERRETQARLVRFVAAVAGQRVRARKRKPA